MDKTASTKETRQKRLNARINARACLIAGILVGFVVICLGAIKIHGYYVELGDATPDELSEKITELSEELAKVDAEKWEENEKNGFSDKYVELNNKSAELSAEISRATNSQYMKETGYNNPKSLGDMLGLAPELWIGALIVAVGVVSSIVIRNKNR